MSNTNKNLQTQTSNTLHNAIMEAGGKDRPPMLAPGIDNNIYSTVDTCPNACEMWKAIERLKQCESINVQDLETNLYWEFGKFTSRDGKSLESYYSRFYKMVNHGMNSSTRSQQAATRNRGNVIVNSPLPIYDQEPSMVAEDDEMSKDKEIDKPMALISLSFKKIYKPTNNNHRTSSNTSRANQDNSPRINKGAGCDNQRLGNVFEARETVDQEQEAHYMYMAQIHEVSLDATDSGLIFDTEPVQKNHDDDDLANEYELLASLIEKLKSEIDDSKNRNKFLETSNKNLIDVIIWSMRQRNEKELSVHQETISILSQAKEAQIKLYKTRKDKELDKVIDFENKVKVLDNIVYKIGQSVQTMNMLNSKCRMSFAKPEFLKKAQRVNPRLYDIGCYNDNLALMLAPESDEVIRLEKENRSKLSDLNRPFDYDQLNNLYDLFVPQQKRMNESISWDQKCKSSKELFKIKRSVGMIFDGVEWCKQTIAKRTYFDHIDPFIQNTIEANFCLEIRKINADLEKFHVCLKEEMVADLRYFNSIELEVDSLKSQLETQNTQYLNEINRLSKEYYYADHMNAILGVYTKLDEVTNLQCKPTIFSDSLERKDFSKSKSVTKNNVSNDFSKPVTAQILPPNIKSILKNTNVLAPGIPQLKCNLMEDGVLLNNSQGKKQDVEDHRRNVKFSNNNTSVTSCNDSLNAKTLNVNFVCATCGKCVLNDKHDMCVLKSRNSVNSMTKMPNVVPISSREPKCNVNQFVAKPLRKTVASKSNQKPRNTTTKLYEHLIEIILFIVDSRCSKHMMGNLKLLINFVEKFLGTMKFQNDHIAPILGYGDLVQGEVTIKRVYYVEGLNHNLFSVGQFCDADLEVAFQKSTCYIRDLKGNDLLTGSRGIDLYSITLQDTTSRNPICLMAKATSSQAWLWHRHLSHLNFDTINLLSKNDIVVGLLKLKFFKDHHCSSCELGKAKRKSFHTKTTPSSKRRLQLLYIDLCGPMRVASINGKRYVLIIVDDYSRYTWTHFLRSKDETSEVLIDFLRLVQRGLQAQVRTVRTDKGTEFLNKTLHAYFAAEGITHQTSVTRTPEENGIIKRRNRTLVEAARTMLSTTKVPLFFWAEAIATTCFTQNRSLVIP
nr:hypothetical protein [Tanacetum cinerariifolium]